MTSLPGAASAVESLSALSGFRNLFYDSLYTRADALFDLTDAVLCADGPVTSLPELTLTAEHPRGHGAMYDALNTGHLEPTRFRRLLASLPLPRAADGRIVLAVDVSNWLRPDAPTSPDRLFCHVYGRGRSADQRIPGWPYSIVAALETGRTSWTAVLDAIRLGPADDATAVTAAQLREVVGRIIAAGHWSTGDADILIVMDSGYDVTRLAHVLADLPVELVGRLRSDRVMLRDAGPRRSTPRGGQPRKHGGVLTFAKPESWHTPEVVTTTDTTRAGEGRVLLLCATAQDVASGQQSVPESAYDAILAKEVLHHVPASQRAGIIAGLSRLLAPGGRLLVAMLPTRIDYPLWPEALELFTSLQPDPDDIAQAMTAAGLTVEVSHATYRLSFTRNRYLSMVRSRYMSLLSHFDDAEIENGITQLLHKHGDTPQFAFQDRFALILGRAGSRAEAAGHV